MSRAFWEDLVVNPTFSELPKINYKLILEQIFVPSLVKIVSTGNVVSKTTTLEVISMESLAPVPTMLRLPTSKHTLIRETQQAKSKKSTKDK